MQDFLVLAASVRHDGKSLAEIARSILGPTVGWFASLAILFIVIIALSGLGVVVVKALGGEQVNLLAGARIEYAGDLTRTPSPAGTLLEIPKVRK